MNIYVIILKFNFCTYSIQEGQMNHRLKQPFSFEATNVLVLYRDYDYDYYHLDVNGRYKITDVDGRQLLILNFPNSVLSERWHDEKVKKVKGTGDTDT